MKRHFTTPKRGKEEFLIMHSLTVSIKFYEKNGEISKMFTTLRKVILIVKVIFVLKITDRLVH